MFSGYLLSENQFVFLLNLLKVKPTLSFEKHSYHEILTEVNLRYISDIPSADGTSSLTSYLEAARFTSGVTSHPLICQNVVFALCQIK